MQIKRWKRLGLLASVIWVIVSGLLASRNETWIAAWRLYCSFTTDPTCAGATVFLVAHRDAIAGIVIFRVAHCLRTHCPEVADTTIGRLSEPFVLLHSFRTEGRPRRRGDGRPSAIDKVKQFPSAKIPFAKEISPILAC